MAQHATVEFPVKQHAPMPAPPERREAGRFEAPLKLTVSTAKPNDGRLSVNPAEARDISATGALIWTGSPLLPMQSVVVAISTEECPEGMSLPKNFVGTATVLRTGQLHNGQWSAALCFGDTFLRSTEFAVFLDFLYGRTQVGPILSNTD